MDKLEMHTPDLTQANVAKIKEIFPGCVTEARDGNGRVRLAVDFDQLRQALSDHVVDGPQERYHLNWPGKRQSLALANASIEKTLRPFPNESLHFDTTKNIFIEGDNLDALKLIQETFLGRVSLIYIDPPYNTGNDFVYDDRFYEDTPRFKSRSNQTDPNGNRLVANLETNGRFHSDWLSMLYPRVKLARNLLSDDGAMFVSIDDREVHNLRKICDEIFGESNLVAQICHKSRASISNDKIISSSHNHLLFYAKSEPALFAKRSLIGLDPDLDGFSNPDNDHRGPWKPTPVDGPGGAKKGNPYYEFMGVKGYWRYSKETMQKKYEQGLIIKTANGLQQKYFHFQAKDSRKTDNTWWDDCGLTSTATRKLQDLMGAKSFDTPKPVELIERILKLITYSCRENALVLDFFAGSATTAHATMQLNSQDGGNRRFILVQLPEATAENSDARQSGYQSITDIATARIRKAGERLLAGSCHTDWKKDVGFRMLKVETSNMEDVYYRADELRQGSLLSAVDNIKSDRTAEDLLFQVLVDWGLDLSLPIQRGRVQDKTVFFVDENALIACFDTGITEELVKELAGYEPLRVVFRDTGFASDAMKINVEQIFRQLSPTTDVKSL